VARRHFDVIILDTAPMLTTNDASDLMPEADTVLFVVRNGSTKRESAFRACEFLRRLDAPTLGIVFNATDQTPATYYYYGYLDTGERTRKGRREQESASASGERLNVN
jgi:Mrp family chromosome partitioning ATPase